MTALNIPLYAFFTELAMLVGMIFLVVSEALVPSGSLPGPLNARSTGSAARLRTGG